MPLIGRHAIVVDEHAAMVDAYTRAEFGMTLAMAVERGVVAREVGPSGGCRDPEERQLMMQRKADRVTKSGKW